MRAAIEQALQADRYETARRLALAALPNSGDEKRAILLLLHKAYRSLGDFVGCREALAEIPSIDEAEKRDVLLLQAGDYLSYGNEDHYRTSAEGRAGLSLDEFIDKYRTLAAQCRAAADAVEAPPLPQPALVPPTPAPAQAAPGSLSGRLTFPDGAPVAFAKVTLGLDMGIKAPDPASLKSPGLGYNPVIPTPQGLTASTSEDGHYEFPEVPAGHHEFLAVTLDPLRFAIATRFLQHGVAIEAGAHCRLDAVVDEWHSAPAETHAHSLPRTLTHLGNEWHLVDELPMHNPFVFDFPRQLVEWETSHATAGKVLIQDDNLGSVISQVDGGKLLFFSDLPAKSRRTYGLYASVSHPVEAPVESPLSIEPESATVVLNTGRASFRLPWSPGVLPPLLAVRGEDGLWRGQGRWVLPAGLSVAGTATRVLEHGPLRARIEIVTTFSNGADYRLIFTAHANEPYLLVRETSPDLGGGAFEFSLAEFSGGRSFLHWTSEHGNRHWHTLAHEERELARLQESVPWWIPPAGFGCAVTPDGLEQKDYLAVFTIRRGEWIDRKFAAITQGPGNEPPERRELDWPYPEMVGSTISMITAHTRADGDVVFRFGFFDGERQWGFLVSDLARNDGPIKELSLVQHKNSSPRLQDFIRWRLDEPDTMSRPHVVARRDDVIAIRKKISRPAFAKARKALYEPGTAGPTQGMKFLLESDPLAAWKMKKALIDIAPVRSRFTLLGRDTGDLYSPVGGRAITHYVEDYDMIAASGVFTPSEERSVRSCLLLMGHLYREPDLMNWHFNSRNANFEADRVDIVGTIGVTFQGNPDADGFARHAAELMERSLEVYCTPGSGKWYENPACYYLQACKCRLNVTYHLATHGAIDPMALPRLKDFLTWGIILLTPKMPYSYEMLRDGLSAEVYESMEKIRRIPPIGDHAVLGKYILDHCALLAVYYRKSDPAFADFLLWAYAETGGFGGLAYGNPALFISRMAENELTVQTPPPNLASRRLEGFGAVFRGNFGRVDEFYLLFKQGPGGYRFHRTEGSIILFANGKPLIYDGGEGGETWRHSTLSFYDTHLPLAAGHVERFASFPAIDFCQGVHPCVIQPGQPVFLSDSCHHDLVQVAFERYNESNPANVRTVLWVKDEYVIMQDSLLLDPAIPRHWHLQVVANSESGSAREGYVFHGRFGTDLQVLLPGPEVDEEAVEKVPLLEYKTDPATSFAMRHLRIRREGTDFYAAVLRPLRPGATPVQAEIFAGGTHLRVIGNGIRDDHFFHRQTADRPFEGGHFQGRYGAVLRREKGVTLSLMDEGVIGAGGMLLKNVGKVRATAEFLAGVIRIEAEGDGEITIGRGPVGQTLVVCGRFRQEITAEA